MKKLTYLLILLSLIIVSCESPTEAKDCAGVAGGTAVADQCGTCDSDTTNDCTQDCADVWGGDATTTECNACTSGVFDCAGTCDGDATTDYCDACTSGVFDCASTCDGTTVVDCAGVCGGLSIIDCAGTCGGTLDDDECGVCDGTGPPAYYDCAGNCTNLDCAGECGGGAVEDACGTCGGSIEAVSACGMDCTSTGENLNQYGLDCNGACGGSAVDDTCGVCDGTGPADNYNCEGECTPGVDCNGQCGGTLLGTGDGIGNDVCGICGGSGPPANFNCALQCIAEVDCAGECNGTAVEDCAGTCDGDATTTECNACLSGVFDCAGECDGTAVEDCAGTCDGDATDCADGLVNEGNEAFFSFMMNGPDPGLCDIVDGDIDDTIDDIIDGEENTSNLVQECLDLSEIDERYNEALALEPNHKGAIFGKAYMELFQISQDELLKTTIDQWENCFKHYIDEFEDDDLSRSIINSNEFEMGFPDSGNAFFSFDVKRILNFIPIITSHEDLLLRNNDNCPEISSVQDVLENVFLTRISNIITKLDQVLDNDFVFTITPAMIEDPEGDKIEIDDTEIYLMKAFMHQIRAVIYAIITYDVDVPYYDIIDDLIEGEGYPTTDMDWSWLSTNSSLLTIRSGQQDSWPNAHADLNNVLNSIESAWTFLKTDTDTEYDAITKDMVEDDDMDPDDMTVSEYIDDIRDILNNPYEVELDFGDCEWVCNNYDCWDECTEESVYITVDIKGFLTNPPQNLKALLPTYSVTTGTCEDKDHDWDDGIHYYSFSIQDSSIEANEYYYFNGSCNIYHNDDGNLNVELWSDNSFNYKVESEMQTICEDIISSYGNNVDYFYMNFYLNGNGLAGQLTLQNESYYNIETYETIEWGCPDITWEADTCEEWKDGWDYTLGGLFPDMTKVKFFNDIVGGDIDEDDCEEILEANLFDF